MGSERPSAGGEGRGVQCELPCGYAQTAAPDLTAAGTSLRLCWTKPRELCWSDEMKFTAAELLARAVRAERNWQLVLTQKRGAAGEHLTPAQRATAWTAAIKEHKEWVKKTTGGVQGLPDVCRLTYLRCALTIDPAL